MRRNVWNIVLPWMLIGAGVVHSADESDLISGPGVEAHWNLTQLIGSVYTPAGRLWETWMATARRRPWSTKTTPPTSTV